MPPDPTGPQAGEAGAGPVLGLLSRGLEFWVRQQCQAIEQLEIQLEGSAWQLMRGRLAGVIVQARGVRYQELEFAEVHLRGEAMAVRMGKLLRQQVLELETPFRVQGTICFSGEGLNRSLAHPNWNWLADQLAEDLLGIQPLASLNLQDDQVVLQACSAGPKGEVVQRAARLEAREGSVAVVGVEGEWSSRVPMDPGIRIETARVGKGRLELSGAATLVP
jgi:hypothetical protein